MIESPDAQSKTIEGHEAVTAPMECARTIDGSDWSGSRAGITLSLRCALMRSRGLGGDDSCEATSVHDVADRSRRDVGCRGSRLS
jgi:hypothetical protein